MTCVIKSDDTRIVFKKGANGAPGYWLVGGKYKVADLSECKILGSTRDRALVVQDGTAAEPPPPRLATVPSAPPSQSIGVPMELSDVPEAQSIMALAGDSVWGGVVILALVMIFRFLNKKLEMDAQAQTNTSQQCAARHTEATSKVDDVAKAVVDIEKRLSSVEVEVRYIHDPRDRHEPRRQQNGPPRG